MTEIISLYDNILKKQNIEYCENCFNYNCIYKNNGRLICKKCFIEYEDIEYKNQKDEIFLSNTKAKTLFHVSNSLPKSMRIKMTHNIWGNIPHEEKVSKDIIKFLRNTINTKYIIKSTDYKFIIKKTVMLFRDIKKICNTRDPIKRGVLAKLFYYISKDYAILYSNIELCNIFNINKKYILSKGSNKIDTACIKNINIRKMLNRKPIKLTDYCNCMEYKFKFVKIKDIYILNKYIKRLKNHPITIKNEPKSIISGIVINFFNLERYKHYNIKNKDIIIKFGVSLSSLKKYENLLKILIY